MNRQERIDIVKKIMQRKEPPFDENDIYYERNPWNKFGAVCDTGSIGVGWCWYKVSVILSKVTDEELVLALEEIENVNMTIEEAIAHAQETANTRADLCDKCRDEHRQLAEWLTELKLLRADYENQKSINYELLKENQEHVNENKELKRLLRLAVEDFETLSDEVVSEDCDFNLFCKLCPFSSNDDYINCAKKWKHAEEALKLLGDDTDG